MKSDSAMDSDSREQFRRRIEQRLRRYDAKTGELDLSNAGILDEEFDWVVDRLRLLEGLDALRLDDNKIGDRGVQYMARHLSGLTALDVTGNWIADAGAAAIAQGMPGLEVVLAGHNLISDDGVGALAIRLECLSTLDLRHNAYITGRAMKHLAQRGGTLEVLDVSENKLSDAGACAIAGGLKKLTDLNLEWNSVGEEGATAIARELRSLKALHIGHNHIRDAGAKAIGSSLVRLEELGLPSSALEESSIIAIARNLRSLTLLNIGTNQAGDLGAAEIARHCPKLKDLNISSNRLGEAGARIIAERLSGLRSLQIGLNEIGAEGAVAISRGLTGLRRLSVDHNSIGDAGATAIAERLVGLTRLAIYWNDISDGEILLAMLRRMLRQPEGQRLSLILANGNPFRFPGIGRVPDEILELTNPVKLLASLENWVEEERALELGTEGTVEPSSNRPSEVIRFRRHDHELREEVVRLVRRAGEDGASASHLAQLIRDAIEDSPAAQARLNASADLNRETITSLCLGLEREGRIYHNGKQNKGSRWIHADFRA